MYGRNLAKRLFSEELFATAQCLSVDKKTLYHGNKQIFYEIQKSCLFQKLYPSSTLIVELSAILRFEFKAATLTNFQRKFMNTSLKLENIMIESMLSVIDISSLV